MQACAAAAAVVPSSITDKIEAKRLVPSDRSWRLKNYYMLVEKQRHLASIECPEILEGEREEDTCCWPGVSSEWGDQDKEEATNNNNCESENDLSGLRFKKDLRRDQLEERINILGTLVKAGCLLASQPIDVFFQHEEEQRLVYSLAYDAYRYRSVFNQALQDTNFFMTFPQLRQENMLVHLLLCQLYRRRFSCREPPWPREATNLQALWHATGMSRVEDALWEVRVRLAAALARLRIKSNALRLEQLLPAPLRSKPGSNPEDGEFNASSTAWINTLKISIPEVTQLLESSGLKSRTSAGESDINTFWIDPRCPGLLRHHPALRADFAHSQLVTDGYIILQGRAFCLGPGMLCRVLEQLSLTGSVVQTHASSPRTTAYLASLLAHCSQPHSLITFGSGTRKAEFEAYLAQLGAVNVRVRAERFCEVPPDSALLDGVVAVLALPTNSNSAVLDPVELACSSGGDLRVLEELAVTAEGGCEAARARQEVLQQEQHATLRLALAAPQIQVVLFESHSSALCETRDLLLAEVESANNAARDRQASLSAHARINSGLQTTDEPVEPPCTDRESTVDSASHDELTARSAVTVVAVPPTDLFEIAALETPSVEQVESRDQCEEEGEEEEENKCPAFQEDGCYLALIKRQEITRLDAQYMIQIAESRGLFGATSNKKNCTSTSSRRTPRRNKPPDLKHLLNKGKQQMKERRNDGSHTMSEVERISAPTVASLLRQTVPNSTSGGSSPVSCIDCPRHARAVEPPPDLHGRYYFARKQDARRWWGEAVQRVLALARIQNPAMLPKFRLMRTPLPGPGASCREVYPLHVHQLHFDSSDDEVELEKIIQTQRKYEEFYSEI